MTNGNEYKLSPTPFPNLTALAIQTVQKSKDKPVSRLAQPLAFPLSVRDAMHKWLLSSPG